MSTPEISRADLFAARSDLFAEGFFDEPSSTTSGEIDSSVDVIRRRTLESPAGSSSNQGSPDFFLRRVTIHSSPEQETETPANVSPLSTRKRKRELQPAPNTPRNESSSSSSTNCFTPPRDNILSRLVKRTPDTQGPKPKTWREFSPQACPLRDQYYYESRMGVHPAPKILGETRSAYIEESQDHNCEDEKAFAEFFAAKHSAIAPGDKVQYLNRSSRDELEVSFQSFEGRLQLNWKGKPLHRRHHMDSSTRRVDPDLDGPLIFIISKMHKMYCHGDTSRGIDASPFHHSSFLKGKDVCFAGGIETDENGFITSISNESGHYQPDNRSAAFALEYLESKGADLSKITYKELIGDGEFKEWNALEFLEKMKQEKA